MNKINFNEKGVGFDIACGVTALICAILTKIFSLITGIDLLSGNLGTFILIIILVMTLLMGYKLNKKYDPEDNYNKYFYIIFFAEVCIFFGLGFL